MISTEKFRELLGEYGTSLSNQEVEEIRDAQYQMAELAFEEWIKNKRARETNESKNDF